MNVGKINKFTPSQFLDFPFPFFNSLRRKHPFLLLFFTIFFSFIIFVLRVSLPEVFGASKNTYIIFYPAVIASALLGGFWSGLCTTLLFSLLSSYFMLPPFFSFAVTDRYDLLGILIFTLCGILISIIFEAFHRTRDIARQQTKRLERISNRLHDSREQLQTVLENVADGIVVRDRKGNPLYANKAALQFFNHASDKPFLSLNQIERLYDVVDEKGKRYAMKDLPVGRVLSGERQGEIVICFRHRKTKKEYWQISRARGIYDSHNSLQYIVIVFSDYTERRKLEKQKDEFLGIASHELRTPVTSIKAYAQLLERRFQQQGNTDAARSVNKINRQLDKLTSLIKDLLDVTKIEQGELEMKHERFEYIELASEIVEDMQRITDHPITSLFCERTVIHGDKERIGQVLINLLSNAAKYSNTSSPIEVRIEKKDNLIWTHVKDTGIGISKEHQQKIFDRFFRSRSKENKNYAGLGLGLYISSQIIARHNGQIQVKSMRDKGSTFSFSLPLPLDRN